ncbi:MAG: aspartate kinase, partial [Chloroflexi bacterium]|nr:aspartate kinase [Chloroflexota bacterium]
AISLSGAQAGIRTNTSHGKAMIAGIEPKRIMDELDRGRIVIVAGFQGVTEDMDITTLGRGGSDTTAVALAASLEAARCEVYTDVDGIYTADPRLVPDARKLDEVGFEEMLELASYGAKMNARSIEMGMVYNVPILVASSFSDGPGTLIHEEANMNTRVGEIRNRIRGVATDTNVAKITVQGVIDRPGIAASLFEPLTDADVSVDVIVQNASVDGTTDMTFTVKRTDLQRALEVTKEVARGLGSGKVISADNLAKVSIVGTGMLDAPGYASRMFRALADSGINIDMITTSEIRITCMVAESQVAKAARALHAAFQLENPD